MKKIAKMAFNMCNSPTIVFTTNPQLLLLLLFTFFLCYQCIPDTSTIQFDLANLNLICRGLDSCSANITRSSDSLLDYNCHCGSFCRDIGTCCLDSRFRPRQGSPRFIARCHVVYGKRDMNVLMVDECGRTWRDEDDGFVREMCSSNGEDRNDPFLAVPVTSPRTGVTYKNYYCAVCNENPPDGQVAFWNVEVRSKTQTLSDSTDLDLKYDSTQGSWTTESTTVTLDMKVPDSVRQKVKVCRSPGQVSECAPDWTDRSTAEKCSAYTALVSSNTNGKFVRYKNPHCALCNFEPAYVLDCEDSVRSSFGFSVDRKTFFVGLFILEDEVKKKKCNRGMVYDGLSKKCRTVRCPRNHVLRDRKCVPNRH